MTDTTVKPVLRWSLSPRTDTPSANRSDVRAYRYLVTLRPGVSIYPERFVQVVEVDGPYPDKALRKALDEFARQETGLWQSADASWRVERVA